MRIFGQDTVWSHSASTLARIPADEDIRPVHLCFRILEPVVFEELARAVEPIQREDALCLELLKEGMERLLQQNGIDATVHGRTKGLISLYRKMTCRLCSVQEVMDKIGLRVIVSSVDKCYAALGLIHAHFQPVPGTFDDYISTPKDDGYRALHACVYPVPGISFKPVEIQILTESMDRQAQFGAAARWRYKSEEARHDHDEGVERLDRLLSQAQRAVNYAEFVELLRRRVLTVDLAVPGHATGRHASLFYAHGDLTHVPQS
jgi:(p)ppGpp synthase/HD superfamily hydrolase